MESSDLHVLLDKSDWILSEDKKSIKKYFVFPDFTSTFTFMTRIAIESEKINHHPNWSNVYNKLSITWSTHDLDGLSELDVKMAQVCDEFYCKLL